ncbi:MAG: ATP-binding cassette domain-containing protein [Reyranella sp.]|nr:ATP-binding cassette domain-containing protein [Reyranella sp.]
MSAPDKAMAVKDRSGERLRQTLDDFRALMTGRFRRANPRELDYPPMLRAAAAILVRLGVRTPAMVNRGADESDDRLLLRFAAVNRARIRHVTLVDGRIPRGESLLLAFAEGDREPVVLLPGGRMLGGFAEGVASPGPIATGRQPALERSALAFHPILSERVISWSELAFFGLGKGHGELVPLAACAAIAALLSLAVPLMMTTLTKAIERADLDRVGMLLGVLAAALIVQALFTMAERAAMTRLEGRSTVALQAALVDRALRLPADAFRKSTPVILATQLESLARLRQGLLRFAIRGAVALLYAFAAAIVLLSISPPAALVALASSVALAVAAAIIGWRQFTAIYEGERMDVIVLAFVYDLIQLVPVIRAMRVERSAFVHWAQNFLAFQSRLTRSATIGSLFPAIVAAWEPITLAVCFAFIAAARPADALGVGAALAFVTALGRLTGAARELAGAITDGSKLLPLGKLSHSFLEHGLERAAGGAPLAPGAGALAAEGVGFGFAGRPLFGDVTFAIPGGSFVGIVGPSGAGKSTLIRLLLGLEAPTRGTVFLDGGDIAKLDRHQISAVIGLVSQDGRPFAGSVLSNIRGIRHLAIDEVWQLAELVGLNTFLRSLPMGLHTILGAGGTGFSAAEVQRLRIARALAGKPRILVLDEAMNAIPPIEREALIERLRRLGMTILVVSHDHTALASADHILEISDGKVRMQSRA